MRRRLSTRFRSRSAALVATATVALAGVLVAAALSLGAASSRPPLLTFGTQTGSLGGQVGFGTSVAVNRTGAGGGAQGEVFVGNFSNKRIEVFTAAGNFVRAFGLDVVSTGESDAGTGPEVCKAGSSPADVCKVGLTTGAAGGVGNPEGLALDQATGNLFVADNTNRRVSVFSPDGSFQGAFGRDVVPGGATTDLEFCTTATTCQAGVAAATAGAFATAGLLRAAITVGPDGHVYVGDRINHRINEFAPTMDGSDHVTGITFVRAIGWGVRDGSAALQTCTTATGCQVGVTTGGANDGQFPNNTPSSVAVDSSGSIYAVTSSGACSAASNPCRIQKFNADGTYAGAFGPGEGGIDGCQTAWTSGNANAQAANGIAVDPTDQHVFVTAKTATSGYHLCEFSAAGELLDVSPATPITTNTTGYLSIAIAPNDRTYINTPISGAAGAIYLLGPVPPPDVEMRPVDPVTDIGGTTATVHGTVTIPDVPPTPQVAYQFEYSSNGISWTRSPGIAAAVGDGAPGSFDVAQTLEGLVPNTDYAVRLVASTGTQAISAQATFRTLSAKPSISRLRVLPIGDRTATLRATLSPGNSPTTYRFDYGTTESYGGRAPSFDASAGGGATNQELAVDVGNLQPDTTYHYRLVATNASGTTRSADHAFTTLRCPATNAVGLPGCMAYELVSPPDLGPVGEAGNVVDTGNQLQSQVSRDGGKVAYVLAYGLPGTTSGGEVSYTARRGADSWQSTQLSPPRLTPPFEIGLFPYASMERYMSSDLSCGFVESGQPLADDAPASVVAAGARNLFRRNQDGSYTTVTTLDPINPEILPASTYGIVGASADCGRVVFTTAARYPGIGFSGPTSDAVAQPGLYEWDHGTLRNVGVIPGPSGPVVASDVDGARPGADGGGYVAAVPDDADRVFFTATSVVGADSGRRAVFMYRDGSPTVDVSQSETSIPNQGAFFQIAARDGSRVLFLSNYGLTDAPSNGPTARNCGPGSGAGLPAKECDLYEYDVASASLRSLSATVGAGNTAGAVVAGVLAASDDGSTVYFAARGQLVPGQGNSYAQNMAGEGQYNIYRSDDGDLSFVAVVDGRDVDRGDEGSGLLVSPRSTLANGLWASRTTPDGEYLLFQAFAGVTGYDSGGVREAFLYSAESQTVVCVSCRSDGEPSVGSPITTRPLANSQQMGGQGSANYLNRPLALSADGGRVFFNMPDALASGAVDGNNNLYVWEKGNVSLLATDVPSAKNPVRVRLLGASADGDSVFFTTARSLSPHDTDERQSVYVARVDGGFAPPPDPAQDCDALVVSSCQGTGLVDMPPLLPSLSPGSGNAVSPERGRVRVGALTASQRKRLARGRLVAVPIRVDRPGVVSVNGTAQMAGFRTKVLSGRARSTGSGIVMVRVRLSAPARRAVVRRKVLAVTIIAKIHGGARAASRAIRVTRGKVGTRRSDVSDAAIGKGR